MAVAAGRQLGVLLGMSRNLGLWQGDYCHNPKFVDTTGSRIATTPNLATCEEGRVADGSSDAAGGKVVQLHCGEVAQPRSKLAYFCTLAPLTLVGEKNLEPLSCLYTKSNQRSCL